MSQFVETSRGSGGAREFAELLTLREELIREQQEQEPEPAVIGEEERRRIAMQRMIERRRIEREQEAMEQQEYGFEHLYGPMEEPAWFDPNYPAGGGRPEGPVVRAKDVYPDRAYSQDLTQEELNQMMKYPYRGKSEKEIRQFFQNHHRASLLQGEIENNKEGMLKKMVSDRQQVDPGLANQALQLRIGKLTSAQGPWNNSLVHARSLYPSHTEFSARDTKWENQSEDFSYAKRKQSEKMMIPGRPIYEKVLDSNDPDFHVFDPRVVHIPCKSFFYNFSFLQCLTWIYFSKIATRLMKSHARENRERWKNMMNPFTGVKGKKIMRRPPPTAKKAGNGLSRDFLGSWNQDYRDNAKINL